MALVDRDAEMSSGVEGYTYWLAASDRTLGQPSEPRATLLRALWEANRSHRDVVTHFDGASFWLAGGVPVARIIRASEGEHGVEVISVDPSTAQQIADAG